jgi:hypothetical protein
MKAVGRPRSTPRFPFLLPWEDERAYAARLADLVTAYAPVGPIERAAVERIALLLQRRDRLALAERAVHMMALEDAATDEYDIKRLAKRARVRLGNIDAPEHITAILAMSEADDANERQELARNRKATDRAQEILEAGGADAYERALGTVDADTLQAWRERVDDEANAVVPDYVPTAESLLAFLVREIAPWEESADQGIEARPSLRLQAIGESLDPARMERLLSIDTRIDRDLERAVAMLVKLQELRLRQPARPAGDGAPLVEGGAPRSRITAHAGEGEAVIPIMRQRRAPADKRSCGS